jgi:cytochrome P450
MTAIPDAVAFFDTFAPGFRIDTTEIRTAAKTNWYARTPMGLAILRYEECAALLRNRRLVHGIMDRLAYQGLTGGPFMDWMRRGLLALEGEQHDRLRRLVSKAFTQRSVERLRPFMRTKAHELVDRFVHDGECEFMTAFADPYPAWVISELLGIPAADFDRFLGWATDLGLGFGAECAQHLERVEVGLAGLYACCDHLLAQRRRDPGDDLISALTAVEQAGDRLSTDEVRALVVMLVFGGQDTTRNQLGLAMATFSEHPDQWRLLADRPELAESAVEELMRVNPTVPAISRVAIEDFTFQGLHFPAGTHIWLFVGAAHHDPSTFSDAPFDITAKRPAQLGFGGGMHYCLGALLARVEMREALPILACRLGAPMVAGPVSWRAHLGIHGPVTLPLRFGTG